MTSNAECEFVFHLGGVIYHGAFAIGGPLHEGAWTDLGGGIIESATSHPGFFVCTGGAHASALDAKSGATHNSYIVSGSATRAVNGRFNRSGHFNGVPCFKNENDLLLFHAASSQIAHKLTAPAHITTGYLDGDRCFFLVYSLDHRMRVTSSSRQYLSERPNFDSYESASLTPSKVVRPILSRDPATGSLRHDRAPCIDGANQHSEQSAEHVLWIRPPETLLVTCYNPVTQQTCAVEVKESEFRDRLIEAEMANVGGAVTLYPDPIDRDEIGRLARLRPVSQADSILGDTPQKRDRWEPIFEEKAFKEKLHTARRRQKACFSLWSKAVAAVAASADQCELSQSRFELASMIFEEALMRRHLSHILPRGYTASKFAS